MPTNLVTIASRCVRLDFHAIADEVIAERLIAEGVAPDAAQLASAGAFGDLDRARLVATDPALAERRHTFARAIDALDGSGFAALQMVKRIETLIDEAAEPLNARHLEEADALQERIEAYGNAEAERNNLKTVTNVNIGDSLPMSCEPVLPCSAQVTEMQWWLGV